MHPVKYVLPVPRLDVRRPAAQLLRPGTVLPHPVSPQIQESQPEHARSPALLRILPVPGGGLPHIPLRADSQPKAGGQGRVPGSSGLPVQIQSLLLVLFHPVSPLTAPAQVQAGHRIFLRGACPVQIQDLRRIRLPASPGLQKFPQIPVHRQGFLRPDGLTVQARRLPQILLHPQAKLVGPGEIGHGLPVSLAGRRLMPEKCLPQVPLHPGSILIEDRQALLGVEIAPLSRLPHEAKRLSLVLLPALALLQQIRQQGAGPGGLFLGGPAQPLSGRLVILPAADPLAQAEAQIGHALHISLAGRPAVAVHGGPLIFLHSPAILVEDAQVVKAAQISPVGGPAVAGKGLLIVPLHPLAALVHISQGVGGPAVSPLIRHLKIADRLLVISGEILPAPPVQESQVEHGGEIPRLRALSVPPLRLRQISLHADPLLIQETGEKLTVPVPHVRGRQKPAEGLLIVLLHAPAVPVGAAQLIAAHWVLHQGRLAK